MGTRKNLYVKDDSTARLARFEAAGGNLSELLAWALLQWERGKVKWSDLLQSRKGSSKGYPGPKED